MKCRYVKDDENRLMQYVNGREVMAYAYNGEEVKRSFQEPGRSLVTLIYAKGNLIGERI